MQSVGILLVTLTVLKLVLIVSTIVVLIASLFPLILGSWFSPEPLQKQLGIKKFNQLEWLGLVVSWWAEEPQFSSTSGLPSLQKLWYVDTGTDYDFVPHNFRNTEMAVIAAHAGVIH